MKMLEQYYKEITRGIPSDMLRDLMPMEVTPAARWFLTDTRQEYWDYTDDFPCIAPPSPMLWMEFEAPDRIESEERIVLNHQLRRSGIMAITHELDPDARLEALIHDRLLSYMSRLDGDRNVKSLFSMDRSERNICLADALEHGVLPRWLTVWNLIAEPMAGNEIYAFGLYGMYLDEQGRVIKGLNAAISGLTQIALDEIRAKHGGDYDPFADLLPFMFSLSLSHCKNVSTIEQPVPAAVAKKRVRRGLPYFTYRVLDIKPVQSAARSKSASEGSESQRAMHVVRGHMKHYTADRPLFGKLTGSYWWHMHRAGSMEAGVADKSYRVKPR